MDSYDINSACRAVEGFVEDRSNWYVRRNRRRFWKSESDEDKLAAYSVLYECLETLTRLVAPFIPFLSEEMYQNLARQVDPDAPESVHLADYPEEDSAFIDGRLLVDMNLLLKIVRLGRAARNDSHLKARQPLSRAVICLKEPSEANSLNPFVKELMEELNVKNVTFAESAEEYVTREVKLNHKTAGPKLKGLVKSVQKRLTELDLSEASKIAARVRSAEKIKLTVDGNAVELDPEDISVVTTGTSGYATSEESGYVVAVNTELSEELVQEGMARDLVRNIQEMRKKAGFEISDRIDTRTKEPPAEVRNVLDVFGDYIAQETLSVSLPAAGEDYPQQANSGSVTNGISSGGWFEDTVRLSEHEIKVAIKKTAQE
jgi:isoleucyl-tRNA synthetase